MPLTIDTQGLHPATILFLEMLQWLHEELNFNHILDMGCGNGILSAVAASIWDTDILAVDISEKAISDASAQMAVHGLEDRVTLLRSDGFAHYLIKEKAPYDLIFFNCLAEPIVRMALEMKSCLAEGGLALIGGILAWKAQETEDYYRGLGFELVRKFKSPPWAAFAFRKPIRA